MRRALLLGVVLAGCQTYDFERVEPIAFRRLPVLKVVKGARADVMLLLDRSGSMGFPIDSQNGNCVADCGTAGRDPCPASCPTRITELKAAMPVFLESAKTQARFGLTLFPANTVGSTPAQQCIAANGDSLIEAMPAEGAETAENLQAWSAQSDRISSYITSTLSIGGGTPTAQSLDFVGTTPGISEESALKRQRVVLLLTDGLPNCRAPGYNDADDAQAVNSVAALKARGISTIVIGFGSTAQGAVVLDDMAKAGGFRRNCRKGRSCGADDACDASENCGRAAYSAGNATELRQVLAQLRDQLQVTDPCVIDLGQTEYSEVFVNFNKTPLKEGAGNWTRSPDHTITFEGAACAAILESTESAPVDIEIGYW